MALVIPDECRRFIAMQRPGGDYAKDIAADFAMIEPHLPESVSSIVDIGCGVGGIDVYLKRKYPNASLTLLDGDGEDVSYGFKEKCGTYNNRKITGEFLSANGVKVSSWLPVGYDGIVSADLIISLLSWGFHYPLSTYRVDGFCIADLRKPSEPIRGKVIRDWPKSARCAFTMEPK